MQRYIKHKSIQTKLHKSTQWKR